MYKLIIFDLDGTLLNTIADLGVACNQALLHFGFPTHTAEEYPRLVGNGVNKLIERALPKEARNEATVLQLRDIFVPFYDKHNCDLTTPYEGILSTLTALRKRGITLAVASNKYQAATEKIVEHFFPNTFSLVLGERIKVPRKPDPQIVYDIIAAMSETISKEEILYIGDSDVDMATAKAAGVTSVACTWGFCTESTLQACQPTHLIHHPSEILTLI